MSSGRNNRGEGYVVVQGLLIALLAGGPWIDPAAWSGEAVPWLAAGGILGAAGVGLAAAGVLALGRNLTPLPYPRKGANLVESGAYRAVRHPIYAGLVLAAFGWALAWRSPITLVLAIVLLVFLDLKSRREERWLVEAFPAYAEYRRRVKKLVPFVY